MQRGGEGGKEEGKKGVAGKSDHEKGHIHATGRIIFNFSYNLGGNTCDGSEIWHISKNNGSTCNLCVVTQSDVTKDFSASTDQDVIT